MARCSAAVAEVIAARLPYISILGDPCFGGVTASFAVQSDVIIAEPGARIGFAGGRVIEQATHDKLPDGFQTAEFLLAHGMVDAVVERGRLRDTVGHADPHLHGSRMTHHHRDHRARADRVRGGRAGSSSGAPARAAGDRRDHRRTGPSCAATGSSATTARWSAGRRVSAAAR